MWCSTHIFSPLVQSDAQEEELAQSHMSLCGADSVQKQNADRLSGVTLVFLQLWHLDVRVLAALMYNYNEASRPLQPM